MKKVILVISLLLLFSCKKDTERLPQAPSFATLKEYNWQSITKHEEKFALDTNQVISYADTTVYSFEADHFKKKSQATLIYATIGNGSSSYRLQKINSLLEGKYTLQPADSTLTLTYVTKTGGIPGWNVPSRDTTIHMSMKILHVSRVKLQLKNIPGPNNLYPVLEKTETYYAVPK